MPGGTEGLNEDGGWCNCELGAVGAAVFSFAIDGGGGGNAAACSLADFDVSIHLPVFSSNLN